MNAPNYDHYHRQRMNSLVKSTTIVILMLAGSFGAGFWANNIMQAQQEDEFLQQLSGLLQGCIRYGVPNIPPPVPHQTSPSVMPSPGGVTLERHGRGLRLVSDQPGKPAILLIPDVR